MGPLTLDMGTAAPERGGRAGRTRLTVGYAPGDSGRALPLVSSVQRGPGGPPRPQSTPLWAEGASQTRSGVSLSMRNVTLSAEICSPEARLPTAAVHGRM